MSEPDPQQPQAGRFSSFLSHLSRFLSHPVSLLLVTGALTGLLVPRITNAWEQREKEVEIERVNRQRELELKTALVRQIGVSSAKFLAEVETANLAQGGRAVDASYRAFQEASLDIGSQLAAYFPDSPLPQRWTNFSYSVRNIYNLLLEDPGRDRNGWLWRLSTYFGIGPINFDGVCFEATERVFRQDLRKLVLRFQQKEAAMVAAVRKERLALDDGDAAKRSPTESPPAAPRTFSRVPCNRYFPR